ncbi:MAG: hypothetical protein R3C99_23925 [Pirellulaceae bacterium]
MANAAGSELTRPPTNDDLERSTWQAVVRTVFSDVDSPRQTPLFDRLWQHFELQKLGVLRTMPRTSGGSFNAVG